MTPQQDPTPEQEIAYLESRIAQLSDESATLLAKIESLNVQIAKPDYDQALASFMAYALSIQSAQPKGFAAPVFSVEPGRKYDRIVIANPHRSVFCFIRKSNGDVLKSANWKTPAKHARGTIFIANGTNVEAYGIGKYGPHYMR